MGKGGAQLGKAVKGKSKERKSRGAKLKDGEDQATLKEDIKMLEEYEKMAKLAEAQRVRLKKLQQQEMENTRINKLKLRNMHRAYMRVEKVAELRKEIELLTQSHEHNMQRNDAFVEMLLHDLDDAEEQHQTAQRAHASKLRQLVELHNSKVNQLLQEFERDLKTLKEEFGTESTQIQKQQKRDTEVMTNIIKAVEAEEADRVVKAKQAHENEREMIRNKNLESINELRINLENKIEDLEKTFDDAHNTYVEKTGDSNKKFKELEEEDANLSRQIARRKGYIERRTELVASWQSKLQRNSKECKQRNKGMREQVDGIRKQSNMLKERMKKVRQREAKRLTELTVVSREALVTNESHLKQAERIMQLAELSRKMETEREKVLPFYESTVQSLHAESKAVVAGESKGESKGEKAGATLAGGAGSASATASSGSLPSASAVAAAEQDSEYLQAKATLQDGTPVEAWGHLENFYKKYNKVLLDKLAIKQEKLRLQKENGDLRAILKQYLDGIAVTSDAVDGSNPLLIVNNRVNLVPERVRRGGPPKTVIEGTQVVSAYASHSSAAVR